MRAHAADRAFRELVTERGGQASRLRSRLGGAQRRPRAVPEAAESDPTRPRQSTGAERPAGAQRAWCREQPATSAVTQTGACTMATWDDLKIVLAPGRAATAAANPLARPTPRRGQAAPVRDRPGGVGYRHCRGTSPAVRHASPADGRRPWLSEPLPAGPAEEAGRGTATRPGSERGGGCPDGPLSVRSGHTARQA
jgi:hypothetical protein